MAISARTLQPRPLPPASPFGLRAARCSRSPSVDASPRPAAAAAAATGPGPGGAAAPPAPGRAFSWRAQWWPVSLLEDLPRDRPQGMTLLGERLVIWPEAPGAYRVFADRCPHRLAPLSEGRVVDGTLACNYHGWRFDGAGRCQTIPQAPAGQEAAFCGSPRSGATAHSTWQSDGLLWVRLERPSGAAGLEAPPTVPAARHRGPGTVTSFQRDLPLDYNEVVENVLDPSHFPFAHHGINGADRAHARPESFAPLAATGPPHHFTMATPDGRRLSYAPPAAVSYAYSYGDFDVLVVPREPGRSRIISLTGLPVRGAMAILPRWWWHLGQNAVLDGDALIQARQRQALDGRVPYAQQVFAPTAADRPVLAYRRWLARDGGHGPFGEVTLPAPSNTPLNDRLAQHLAICGTCAPVMQHARRVEAWGQTGHLALLGLAAAAAPRHARLAQRLALLSLAILAVSRGAAALAGRLQAAPARR